jgi:hypothetical protein
MSAVYAIPTITRALSMSSMVRPQEAFEHFHGGGGMDKRPNRRAVWAVGQLF